MLEDKAKETILQDEMNVNVGGKTYKFQQPTLGTLIMISQKVAKLPIINGDNTIKVALAYANHADVLAEILAILVLGAKDIKQSKKKWWKKSSYDKLVCRFLECSPTEIYEAMVKGFKSLDLGVFFGCTTFLKEVNLLKQTREVD